VKGEDMQFNVLSDEYMPHSRWALTEGEDTKGVSPDVDFTCLELNATSDRGMNVSEYCFGEQPLSFRGALKRYVTTSRVVTALTSTVHKTVDHTRNIMLIPNPPYENSGTHLPNLLGYLGYAYLGVKGGMRHRLRYYNTGADPKSGESIVVCLEFPSVALVNNDGSAAISVTNYVCSEMGGAQFMPRTNGGVEVEFPYYSPNLFSFAFADDFIGGYSGDRMSTEWVKNYKIRCDDSLVSSTVVLNIDSATAEDFTLMRFSGAPYYSAIN